MGITPAALAGQFQVIEISSGGEKTYHEFDDVDTEMFVNHGA
jgi:hypothetical protein